MCAPGGWRALAKAHMEAANAPVKVVHGYTLATEEACAQIAVAVVAGQIGGDAWRARTLRARDGVSANGAAWPRRGIRLPMRRRAPRNEPQPTPACSAKALANGESGAPTAVQPRQLSKDAAPTALKSP
jgi:hypothetical protein